MKTAAFLVLLWGMSAALAAGLQGGKISGTDTTVSISEQLFGSARSLIGNRMVLEADRYFHQGVGHTAERLPLNDLMMRWNDAIAPTEHTVLSGGDLEEIMPWFRFATRMDPQNVETYVTAAYWALRGGRPERARLILEEALRNNPGSFDILLAMGHALRHDGQTAAAEKLYVEALNAWSPASGDRQRETRVQVLEVLLSLGSLCEDLDKTEEAIRYYTSISERFPEHQGILDRVAALERGERPPGDQFWNHSLANGTCSHGCSHDHEPNEDCGHADHEESFGLVLTQEPHACSEECTHEH